jgi:hypothetical protein
MNRLRDALGDSADSPRFVETMPKRGYRFIAPVEVLPRASGSAVSPEFVSPPLAAVVRAASRAKAWLVLAAGLAIAGGVATVLYIRRAPALTERDTVVLADFENRTGVS